MEPTIGGIGKITIDERISMKYIIRLDDACEKRDIDKWDRMEKLLDKYSVNPLVGVIPHCEDSMMNRYPFDRTFWDRVNCWMIKGWTIAMHGYNHVCNTSCGGINPVNGKSEFAGESLEIQKEKIKNGIMVMHSHGIEPQVFFAPSHTFDENTIIALKECSEIKIVSDTIANNVYSKKGITFVPQQSGRARRLPLSIVTFCYHPNTMDDKAFVELELFLENNQDKVIDFPLCSSTRQLNIYDWMLQKLYFSMRKKKR